MTTGPRTTHGFIVRSGGEGPPAALCKCGHPKNRHYPECICTTYVSGPNGVSATPCMCHRYDPKEAM